MEFGKAVTATHVALRMDGRERTLEKPFACHTCDTPICVNQRHLFWGTQTDNMQDYAKKGHHFSKRETCKHGHAWTPENTFHHPGRKGLAPHRVCLACRRNLMDRNNEARRSVRASQKLAKASADGPLSR